MSREQKMEQELDQAIAALPRELQPERDLWPSLEQRLPAPQHRQRRQMSVLNQLLGVAAALVLLVVVGWRVMSMPDNAGQPVADTDGDVDDNGQLPAQYFMARQYETLKAEQLGQLAGNNENFGDWRYQLATWDHAINQVSGALDYYPDDPGLLSKMQGLYEQQLSYMQLIGSVDSSRYFSGEEL